jgi:glycosyltransferase involved in cell wall biosynthesis
MAANKSPLNILFLVSGADRASTRYRVTQYFPYLESEGNHCEIMDLSNARKKWVTLYQKTARADVVFVQRKLFSIWEVFLLRKFSKILVFDFDDSLMFKSNPKEFWPNYRQKTRFKSNISRYDLVISGNEYLAEQAKNYNDYVVQIPTVVDLERYSFKGDSKIKDEIIIGWIGKQSTLKYLKKCAPFLEKAGELYPNVKLKIVADDFFDLEKLAVIKKNWNHNEEIADLHSFDIGIMPLENDPWTMGKCGLKLLQYMAVGVPVVCSPVGVNRDIVTHNVEGFWAETEQEWIDRMGQLIRDKELRWQMGFRGRQKVEKVYSLTVNAPKLLNNLQRVVYREKACFSRGEQG